jgi:hypothetical protein
VRQSCQGAENRETRKWKKTSDFRAPTDIRFVMNPFPLVKANCHSESCLEALATITRGRFNRAVRPRTSEN